VTKSSSGGGCGQWACPPRADRLMMIQSRVLSSAGTKSLPASRTATLSLLRWSCDRADCAWLLMIFPHIRAFCRWHQDSCGNLRLDVNPSTLQPRWRQRADTAHLKKHGYKSLAPLPGKLKI